LCHDAQYVAAEREARRGWGHSVVSDVCALARMADVEHLVLFHHDPQRSDAALDQIQARARRVLHPHRISCTAAYEGLTLTL
jgi:ribonuclease BN (tRNA processing enzyme)